MTLELGTKTVFKNGERFVARLRLKVRKHMFGQFLTFVWKRIPS